MLVVPGAVRFVDKVFRFAGDAVAAQQAHGLGQSGVIGHGHATFPRGDDLHRVKAKDRNVAVVAVACGFVVIPSAEGVAGIFDDPKTIFLSQAVDLFHVAGQAREVYRDHHLWQTTFGLGSHQFSLQLHGTHIAGIGFDIDKIDLGATIEGAVGGGHEADGGGPDPVTWAHSQCQAGNVQGGGAGVDRNPEAGAAVIGDSLFETGNDRPLSQKVGSQDLHHGLDVRFTDRLSAVRDHSITTC